jgi:hypothetical protein
LLWLQTQYIGNKLIIETILFSSEKIQQHILAFYLLLMFIPRKDYKTIIKRFCSLVVGLLEKKVVTEEERKFINLTATTF